MLGYIRFGTIFKKASVNLLSLGGLGNLGNLPFSYAMNHATLVCPTCNRRYHLIHVSGGMHNTSRSGRGHPHKLIPISENREPIIIDSLTVSEKIQWPRRPTEEEQRAQRKQRQSDWLNFRKKWRQTKNA